MARREVISSKKDIDGNLIGRKNANLIFDSHRYEVDFDDGEVTELTDNFIAERMYDQCEKSGNDLLLLYSFIDYQKSEQTMSLQDQQITVNERACKKRSTAVWEICVLCKYQSTTGEKLSDLK